MFSVEQIRKSVFHVKFDSSRELSMAFLRYQEFYESKYDHIRESKFTLVQQMGAYCREYLEDNDSDWTYASDWQGYNIPAEIIKQVHDLGIPDPNHYDSLMLGIHGMIMCETMNGKAYIIGTSQANEDEEFFLRHEMTHAMFYLNDEYRELTSKAIDRITPHVREKLFIELGKQNYPRKVIVDEIQAYMTTGESGFFDSIEEQDELDGLRSELKSVHKKFYTKFINEK